MDSEADLMRRAKSLDEDALAAIFDAYYPLVYRYLYHATGHRQTAEDLAAQVFHQFLAALHAGRGPDDHLKAWLFRVAANLVVDDHRRQKYRADVALEDDLEESAPGLEARCESAFWTARLQAALATLTPKQQQVIALRFWNGLTPDETARRLALTAGSVKSLQHRALAALRRVLEGKKGNDDDEL